MNEVSIYPASDEEVRSGDIGRRLRQFNYRHVGEYPEQRGIRLNAKNSRGNVVGGLRAFVFLYWLRVEVLYVDEAERGNGIGSLLLLEAERLAKEEGAENSALDTFEWQAPGFYAKHGYEEVGRIDGYAKSFYLSMMRKRL